MRQSTDTAGNGTSRKPLEKGGGAESDRKVGRVLRPGDGKRARFESRFFQWVLFRKRGFYSKCLLLGAIASEAARRLMCSSG